MAGSPARRRGHFLLRGQKKVTKEEALNRLHAVLTTEGRRSGDARAVAQVLTAFVNVSRLPKGSVTDKSREPQGVSWMPGRAWP